MRRVYGGCHARWIMSGEPSSPGDSLADAQADSPADSPADPLADDAADGASETGVSPTAGGRAGWIVIGVVGVVLVAVLGLTYAGPSSGAGSSTAGTEASTSTTAGAAGSSPSGACTAAVAEALDPTAAIRLLPNAQEPTYATDPPSSGAFVVGATVEPVSSTPLSRPVQVGLLAQGKVLIQYNTSLSAADVTDLEGLAGDDIVVAPNPTMADPIVATAWRARQICGELDLSALRQFATLRANQAPDAAASTTTTT